ncbi:MAG: hypothetical protein ACQESN_11280 [Thermotogota bacterium]
MRVYAEYFEEDGLTFRKNTLLQFGGGWKLVGNAVLANPGSAEPIGNPPNEVLGSLSEFYETYRESNTFLSENWFEFSPDSTMRFIEKIFNGWYVGKHVDLNGVIQLFNTFNVRDQKLSQAIDKIGINTELLFSYNVHKYFHDKSTYFGFSNEVLNNQDLRKVAEHIFTQSSERVRRPYQKQFSENSFYHPMYVNRAHRQKHFQSYKYSVLEDMVVEA